MRSPINCRHSRPRLSRLRRQHVAGAACLTWLAAGPARAADLGTAELPTDTIAKLERLRDYDLGPRLGAARVSDRSYSNPEGVRLGSFVFYPTLGTLVRADDNIFTSATDRKRDLVSEVTPGLRVKTDLPRHAFDLSLGGRIVSFAENEDQSYAEYKAAATGSLHFGHAHTLSASALSMMEHEDGFDPGRPMTAARPVEFIYNRASVGLTRDVGQLYGTLSATAASWDYKDTVTRDGTALDQDQRDTDLVKGQISGGYRFSPGYELRARAAATRIWNQGNGFIDRDAVGGEMMAGISGELNPLFRWQILGGWGFRDYDQAGLATLGSYLYEAQATWLVTQRLTLYGTLGRSLAEPADNTAIGRIDTRIAAKAELELWHNLVGRIHLEAREAVYSGINQVDHTISGGVGIEYHLSDNWLFTIAYDYTNRQSSVTDGEITRNRLSIGAKLRF